MADWIKELKASLVRQKTKVTPMRTQYGMSVEDPHKKHMILKVPKDKIIDPQKLAAILDAVIVPSSIETVPERLKLPHIVLTQTNAFTRLTELEVPSSLGSGMVLVQHGRDKLKFHMNGTLWIVTAGKVPEAFNVRCTTVKIPKDADVWLEEEEPPAEEAPKEDQSE